MALNLQIFEMCVSDEDYSALEPWFALPQLGVETFRAWPEAVRVSAKHTAGNQTIARAEVRKVGHRNLKFIATLEPLKVAS